MKQSAQKEKARPILYTVGHSTRPNEDFVGLLEAYGIEQLIDVRTIPKSRHNPQFGMDALSESLRARGIKYSHIADLGGLRQAKKDSINTGWRNTSFRGYADYMQTEEFANALKKLEEEALAKKTVIMCAEAVPWRCHRSMIADALVADGWEVRHIMSPTVANEHKLASFAKVEKGQLFYPPDEAVDD